MSWVTIILLILKYGPVIWEIVMQIIDMIKKIQLHMTDTDGRLFANNYRARLQEAVKFYRRTKSKRMLEELHGELTVQLSNFEK